jgi:TonB family protein
LHSIDTLVTTAICAALWFHPLVYVIRRELRLVHEFEADAVVARKCNRRQYQQTLLSQQLNTSASVFATSFTQSPLKLRFAMMNSSFRQNMLWRLAAATFALMLVVAACTKDEISDEEVSQLIESQMDGDLLSAADASDVEGMTLTSIDTIITFDPDSYKESVTYVKHYEEPGTNRSKSIVIAPDEIERGTKANATSIGNELFRSKPVYKVVDEMPKFTECVDTELSIEGSDCATKALLEYVYKEIKYPEAARTAGIEGVAVVSFIVGTDGEVMEQRIERNPADGKHEEAARQIREELLRITADMPAWVPGQQNGEAVQVRFNLPIRFALQ